MDVMAMDVVLGKFLRRGEVIILMSYIVGACMHSNWNSPMFFSDILRMDVPSILPACVTVTVFFHHMVYTARASHPLWLPL